MRLLAFVLFCLTALAVSPVMAQEVVHEDGNPNPYIRAIRGSNSKSGTYVPEMSAADPDGSAAIVSGDFYDSDLIILVKKEEIDQLIPRAIALADRIGRPNAIIRIRFGRVIGGIDIEFNRYMTTRDNVATTSIPLGVIVSGLQTWGLPKPFGVAIIPGRADVTFHGQKVTKLLPVDPSSVAAADRVTFVVTRHWYGLASLAVFGSFLAFSFGTVFWLMLKKPAAKAAPAGPKTFAEAQAKYDKANRKTWAPFLIPLTILVVFVSLRQGLDEMSFWLPPSYVYWMPQILVGLMLSMVIASTVLRRRRPQQTAVEPQMESARKLLGWIFIPMMVVAMVLPLVILHPQWLYRFSPPVASTLLISVLLVPLLAGLVASSRHSRKSLSRLGPGDPDFDAAADFARRARIRIPRVFVRKGGKIVNAFAGLSRHVTMTEPMLEKLTFEERRCIIAHEIGHIKGNHVPWLTAFGVLFLIAYEILIFELETRFPPFRGFMVAAGPLGIFVFIFALQFARAPLQKKAEYSADRFSLESIGSFEEVARAMAKIHLLNASPYQLKPFHESLASHPSLLKRLRALEEVARSLGMSVPSGGSEEIIAKTTV